MPLLAVGASYYVHEALIIIALLLGFGFVIFFHELGHFLAAKWVGIKVEQFAVGFGQAILAWRKGIGWRVGSTQKEYRRRLDEYVAHRHPDDPHFIEKDGEPYQRELLAAEKALDLGETEYRLNWMPLGGYVKMLGQDDLRPNSQADDPRSYNRKSVGARMVVVSAGVIMNVILAGIGFMVLFLIGFHVPPAWVGNIQSASPAQKTVTADGKPRPLQVGDRILDFEGRPQEDFTKIGLNVALAPEGAALPIKVQHVDGSIEDLRITPQKDAANGFLSIGIRAPQMLEGPDPKDAPDVQGDYLPDINAIRPGETVTAINGQSVDPHDFCKLDQAMQSPGGKPVRLTVRTESGKSEDRLLQPHFEPPFGGDELQIAGMMPRPMVEEVMPDSAVRGTVKPGDAIVSIMVQNAAHDMQPHPTGEQLRTILNRAGQEQNPVKLTVLRDGKVIELDNLSAAKKLDKEKGRRGLGIGLLYDDLHPVVAGIVPGSPADNARIPAGATITTVNGHDVANWFDLQRWLADATAGKPLAISFTDEHGQNVVRQLTLNAAQVAQIDELRRGAPALLLKELIIVRQARTKDGRLDPLKAAYWGVTETRDFILQFYLTLRRMVGGSVSPNQLMGPIGIFQGGVKFGFKGWDWLLWFLAMISANLAVVNFLPIPIVDGGLFTFLILEKIQGKPLSPRTQAIAQYVGLALLVGVFLFVTYHDIMRI